MTGEDLKEARRRAGWTQERLAKRLSVTQAYVSLMEAGRRHVPDRVKRQATSLLGLSPMHLPLLRKPGSTDSGDLDVELEQALARLGYPGLVYRRKPGPRRNPVEVLFMGLSAESLDPRLAEALPWLLL